jgi:hypothetical protein
MSIDSENSEPDEELVIDDSQLQILERILLSSQRGQCKLTYSMLVDLVMTFRQRQEEM